MSKIELNSLVRDSVKRLKGYHVENFDCEIKLHANENPFPPPAEILRLLREDADEFQLNRYPDPQCRGLKQALARKLQVPVRNLAIGNGSDELIQILLQIFCGPGDRIGFPDPTFAMYSILAEGMGLKPVTHPLDEAWDFRADEFLNGMAAENPKILFFSYPNNPTGNCFSPGEIEKVLQEFGGIVVVDEAYHDFAGKSFLETARSHNNLVILRSLSKIGLAGLRVGFCVADPFIIDQIDKVRLPYNSNTVSQTLAEKLLKHFAPVQEQIDRIVQERQRMIRAMAEIAPVETFPSDSNFILFRVKQDPGILFKQLVDKNILVRDLSSHPKLKGCLRVTVGTREENDQFLLQIESLMRPQNIRNKN